ncbi:MAG: L-2-hydroxyglutarate oxidase [Zavarzinella sp.]
MDTDVVVVGAGIVGLATALHLSVGNGLQVHVIEAEPQIAQHQTGHNSGVIHAGVYYKPGSEKALNSATGRELMYRFCRNFAIPHEQCGKLIVATHEQELAALEMLYQRTQANGLKLVRRLNPQQILEIEPSVSGIAGLHVGETGIVDYRLVTDTFADLIKQKNGSIQLNTTFMAADSTPLGLQVETNRGKISTKYLVNCAGLFSDRVAQKCGVQPGVRIVPFRGEYYELAPRARHFVKNLIYPVPDPKLPFLGVHFTRRISGEIEAGPNAVLAFARKGYRKQNFSASDMWDLLRYRGFWKMAAKNWHTGIPELVRSFSQRLFVRALQKLVPAVRYHDIIPAGAGVRAQAVDDEGKLIDDFRIINGKKMTHVLNAPSPAATASISIGATIAKQVCREMGLSFQELPIL